jgi:primosomal protein N' (replication factor Y)
MKSVEVVINLATSKLNNSYTYAVPEKLAAEVAFGKRILIDFGGKKVEGYIVTEQREDCATGMKPVLKVLDSEAVFDSALLELARWMAEYYLCPLALALNLMVPRILHRQKGSCILPTIDAMLFKHLQEQGAELNQNLFTQLWDQGELAMKQALKYVNREELLAYEQSGFITSSGVYRRGRVYKKGQVYSLGNFNPELDLPPLQRRAPRQAEIMQLLLQSQELSQEYLDGIIAPASMRALLKKDYVHLRRVIDPILSSDLDLNEEQKLAVRQLEKALLAGKHSELLLFGVTGSGKTEVYLKAAEMALAQGRGVIILVPEIALTRQLVDVFASRIEGTAVLHSGMSSSERYDEWRRIKHGEARLVLGARSAVFAPVLDLGLVIIDEEQEGSFKQEELPRYHAREVARQRARLESAVMLGGSATPAIETYWGAREGAVKLLVLQERVGGGRIPQVTIEDMRKAGTNPPHGLLGPLLRDKIKQSLDRGEQIILFINRRGYTPMTICGECGNIAKCPACSVGMTYHRDIGQNVCHYCNRHLPIESKCSRCGSKHLQQIGAGTQRIEEETRRIFPQARVERLDIDSSRRQGAQKSILDRMKKHEIDILIGTQMVAKGLDFPDVSLMGIVDADSILNLPDFRAGERCFQLLVQAAGRAGRSNGAGEVIIQTYNPDHPVIQLAASQDYRRFYKYEIAVRKMLNYPPFTELLRIVFSAESEEQVQAMAATTAHYIEDVIDASEEEILLLGPAPCPIQKIRHRYRYQLIIKCGSLDLLRSIASYILAKGTPKHVKIEIDLNPITTI